MAILVTGGAGYIGSHTVLALLQRGEEVVVLDNLTNSSEESLHRVEQLTGKAAVFYLGDVQDRECLGRIFASHKITSVIHFAGLKAVGESTRKPLEYYQNNVTGTLVLLGEMRKAGVHQFIFSSSATVYGANSPVPYIETTPIGGTTSPYGTSKLMVEQILQDFAKAEPQFSIIALRYFNPVGAHESGLIGEDPNGIPNNLLPYISQVAIGKLEKLGVFGGDYPTKDGTGVRDYIHVMDLAEGHLAAMDKLNNTEGFKAYNLGAGVGYSVLEMIAAFEKASNTTIPFQILPRREGDLPAFWADAELAKRELSWAVHRDIDVMMRDTWNWQSKNPNGYR
ncbi:UDP-glucose 4-epimerase GalE [Serratia liquefaciens]|jgi:UDP-glucose 4-epimerase|uniref:UDP-glucose 4-epimerase GalE n=2 Tax=Serratia liquefaciens TaxID=614 RepID=UPI000DFD252C|nr:UDP-glucose 4-epimerase GalE [Serratia liquefaciens]MBF8104358.1 UDP-glucose 4-epimerase GalE [Serratia liquefaciens]CAB1214228.1 UDP-glucose 4-epimerase [Serratia liquefaciens]CAI1727151.1 UDP-glucose 4-epimerase [Serratia liquefaciens]CAI1747881.1 UDP-glucose 4-epimerase [Serratia liquefaciens]CAI2455969.1 UDP-glucose 4-epimerase [Serratia liquefaciens]